jgi:hypothetical protein
MSVHRSTKTLVGVGTALLLGVNLSSGVIACWRPYHYCTTSEPGWCNMNITICEGTQADASSTNPGKKAAPTEVREGKCETYTAWSAPCTGGSGTPFPCDTSSAGVLPSNGSCCRYGGGVPSATSSTGTGHNIEIALGESCTGPTQGNSNPYGD